MRIIYQGAEIPSNRTLLEQMGVEQFGVGFKGMRSKDLSHFTGAVHLYPGWTKTMTADEHHALAAEYDAFIEANVDRLASWTEYDGLDPDTTLKRRAFYDQFDDACFRPVWTAGTMNLESLADLYPRVLIRAEALTTTPGLAGLLRTLSRKYDTTFDVFGAQDLDGPFEHVYTTAWTSPMRYGETIIFDGELKRFPKKMKDVRPTYRPLYDRIGLDADKIIDGKPKELSKLAVWSLQQVEAQHAKRPNLTLLPTNSPGSEDGESDPPPPAGADNTPAPMRNAKPRTQRPLPVVGVSLDTVSSTDAEGNKIVEQAPVLVSGTSMRACDTCFLASNCPEYSPGSTCAFHFSPQIRSRDQVIALLQTLIETQTERVFFARMVEQVNGDYPDPTVGKEMDRLMGLVAKTKDMEDNKEFLRLTVERQTSGGILGALFGKGPEPRAIE